MDRGSSPPLLWNRDPVFQRSSVQPTDLQRGLFSLLSGFWDPPFPKGNTGGIFLWKDPFASRRDD